MTPTTICNQTVTLETQVSAVCTEKVDAGVNSALNVFHLYFEFQNPMKTFCGIDLERNIVMIDQGVQGKLKDAKVSCGRCEKSLNKLLRTIGDKGKDV